MKHGTLLVERLTTGPFAVNTYLVGCSEAKDAAVIDPGGDSQQLIEMLLDLANLQTADLHPHLELRVE